MPSSARTWPVGVSASGLTSTSVASSSMNTRQSLLQDVDDLRLAARGSAPAATISTAFCRRPRRSRASTRDHGQRLGPRGRDLLDLHAARDTRHREEGAVGPVEQEGHVVLVGDVDGLGDSTVCTVWPLMSMPRIWPGLLLRLVRAVRQLHAAGLAPTAGLHLGLHHRGAELAAQPRAPRQRWCRPPRPSRDPVLPEQVLRLVLEQVHADSVVVVVEMLLLLNAATRLPRCRRR